MEKILLILSIFCVLAGIMFFGFIIAGNKNRLTGKTAPGWYIPATGFLLLYAVVMPLYFSYYGIHGLHTPALEWIMWILAGASVLSWIVGKFISRR